MQNRSTRGDWDIKFAYDLPESLTFDDIYNMEFKEWLLNEYGNNLHPFSNKGKVTLYHYLNWLGQPPAKIILDPKLFGKNSYTANDVNASSTPKIFFYLNPDEKERYFNKRPLYTTTVNANEIYDLLDDPFGFKKELREKNNGVLAVGQLVKKVKANRKPGFKGYYSKPDRHVVGWFYPIEVSLLHDPLVMAA